MKKSTMVALVSFLGLLHVTAQAAFGHPTGIVVVEIAALPEKDDASNDYGCHLTGVLVSDYK